MHLSIIARALIACLIISMNSYASPTNKETLLAAWEAMQPLNEEVASFQKTNNGYLIKFNTIPFEGEVSVLNIDIEEEYYERELPITHVGVVQLNFPNEFESIKEKYNRNYYQWSKHSLFYLNADTKQWMNSDDYQKLSAEHYKKLEDTALTQILKRYSGEVFFFTALLFLLVNLLQWRAIKALKKAQDITP
ncbi:hypothetical protein [Litorilituus sediminis]|uniref:Uncharacterized protein n=1 Tax=Litorilituus sediminis TaxID=718192 RepID=A0A4P6P1K5_9GAMM|nr:hypothetical protein [Litorilituus sediminis]QBG34933.1 hypothetical protein EMK97_03885 [Litorilituus sediminis]